MNEIIKKRKSIRKYHTQLLDDAALENIQEQIYKVKPLYPDIRYSIKITNKAKGMFNVKAPHYLVFESEEKEGSYENIGFIGQQLDLFFSASGIGSCWLGASKPEGKISSTFPHVICMSFGKPAEPLHRELVEFKRKPLTAISEGADSRLEAARLAPSGVNAQNWYFVADNGKIHCYIKKPNLFMKLLLNKMSYIDLGIAICYLYEESNNFRFVKESNAPVRKGCIYIGTVL